MKSKMEKWLQHEFSTGSVAGDDYQKFQKEAKAELKKTAAQCGLTLHCFNKNHYCFSAVLKQEAEKAEDVRYVYVSISDVRFVKNEWYNNVLCRIMANDKDWSGKGGNNNYTSWSLVAEKAKELIEKG